MRLLTALFLSFSLLVAVPLAGPHAGRAAAANMSLDLLEITKAVARVKGGKKVAQAIEAFLTVKQIAAKSGKLRRNCRASAGFVTDMIQFVKDGDSAGFALRLEKRFDVSLSVARGPLIARFDRLHRELSRNRRASGMYLKRVRRTIWQICRGSQADAYDDRD